jgi:hypothetical protein
MIAVCHHKEEEDLLYVARRRPSLGLTTYIEIRRLLHSVHRPNLVIQTLKSLARRLSHCARHKP